MTHSTKKVILITLVVALLTAIIVLFINMYKCDKYFIDYLDGFWVGKTIDGQIILYLDNGSIRIIETNDILETSITDKCKYELTKKTWFDMYDRSYELKLMETDKITSKIGKLLASKKMIIDLFSIEGTCIIRDNTKDIITLVKDINANLSLLKV